MFCLNSQPLLTNSDREPHVTHTIQCAHMTLCGNAFMRPATSSTEAYAYKHNIHLSITSDLVVSHDKQVSVMLWMSCMSSSYTYDLDQSWDRQAGF